MVRDASPRGAEVVFLESDMHPAITGAQNHLYSEYAKTGQPLTWEAIQRIETQALVEAKASPGAAAATVKKAIESLKAAGITPMKTPWGGKTNVNSRN